jgi:hypothetical protein
MKDLLTATKEWFRENYSYVELQQLPDIEIISFLNLSHVQFNNDGSPTTFSMKMNLLYDYIISQDLVDVQE